MTRISLSFVSMNDEFSLLTILSESAISSKKVMKISMIENSIFFYFQIAGVSTKLICLVVGRNRISSLHTQNTTEIRKRYYLSIVDIESKYILCKDLL